jgi:hypothetical protein
MVSKLKVMFLLACIPRTNVMWVGWGRRGLYLCRVETRGRAVEERSKKKDIRKLKNEELGRVG